MLQVFQRHIASVSDACCSRLFKIFHLFKTYVASVFYLDIALVLHICCKSMFEIFHLFQSYVTINVFMLQIASVLSRCCICFTRMLQFVCFKCFICFRRTLHPCVSCFRGRESWRHGQGVEAWGVASRGSAVGVRNTPRILRTGCACPHAGSQIPSTQRERRGSGGRSSGRAFLTVLRRPDSRSQREEVARGKKRRAQRFLRARITEMVRASRYALLSDGASISLPPRFRAMESHTAFC
jgi:hypothetical protein